MDIILMLIQFFTLVQISTLNDAPVEDDELSEYLKGREWVCKEYYTRGRSMSELDSRFLGVFDPDEFQQGALAALRELHRRHHEKD